MRAHARLGAVEGCHPFISSLNINSEDSIKLAQMTCGLCLHTPVMMEYFPFLARALRATRHPPQFNLRLTGITRTRKPCALISLTWVNSIVRLPSHAALSLLVPDRNLPSGRVRETRGKTGIVLMAIHKTILEWQASHPNITWIGWGIVWAVVLSLLFWPSKGLG